MAQTLAELQSEYEIVTKPTPRQIIEGLVKVAEKFPLCEECLAYSGECERHDTCCKGSAVKILTTARKYLEETNG